MAYRRLTLDPGTPDRIRALIRTTEDHFFADVHTMLKLPQHSRDLRAGCNFAITQLLTAVVSGISVTLYSRDGGTGKRFRELLARYYPWEPDTVTVEDRARAIYDLFRNPLTHDLGLDLEGRRKTQKLVIKRIVRTPNKGLTERAIERLERDVRLVTPSPTLAISGGRTVLTVEVFYAGVRRMIESLSCDVDRMNQAQAFLHRVATKHPQRK